MQNTDHPAPFYSEKSWISTESISGIFSLCYQPKIFIISFQQPVRLSPSHAEIPAFLNSVKLVPIGLAPPVGKLVTIICPMIVVVSTKQCSARTDLLGLVAVIYREEKDEYYYCSTYTGYCLRFGHNSDIFLTRRMFKEVELASCNSCKLRNIISKLISA